MADAASIGASFSDYQGNKGLGGGNDGVIVIDTKPLENLATYTMMYKKSQWDQQKKETDAKVAQLADLSNIALNDLRGKDKEQATKEFADLQVYASEYARKAPKNAQERMQNELDWQTKYGAFKNNFNSGKQRAVSYQAQLNTIKQNIPEASTQDEAIKQLNKTFDSTDIGTTISAVPNFKMEKFDIPDPSIQKFNNIAILGNDNVDIEGSIYNPKQNAGIADKTILGIKNANIPKTIKDAKGNDIVNPNYGKLSDNEKNQVDLQSTVESDGKGWVDSLEPLNTSLAKYTKDGKFDAESFENDNASYATIINPYNALKIYDSYNKEKYNQAQSGMFTDKGVPAKLPDNVTSDDFKVGFVDFAKGVNANQLVQSGMFAKYKGDNFQKKITHSGDQRAMDLERMRELNAVKLKNLDEGGENYRKGLGLIEKGFIRDANGKWQAPAKGAVTTSSNDGVIPYWQNYIAPQIDIKKLSISSKEGGFLGFNKTDKETNVPSNFTGDVGVSSDKISGLSVVLTGELNSDGKQKSYSETSNTKIRFQDGNATGVVIDGVFYDQNVINSKATNLQDKVISNKFDAPIFNQQPASSIPPATPSKSNSGAMSDEEYKNFLKKNGLK